MSSANESGIIKTGWLHKQGAKVKNWKRRWFLLESTRLEYRKDPADAQPLGMIELDAQSTCNLYPETDEREAMLELVTPHRTFLMRASEACLREWWEDLQDCISALGKREKRARAAADAAAAGSDDTPYTDASSAQSGRSRRKEPPAPYAKSASHGQEQVQVQVERQDPEMDAEIARMRHEELLELESDMVQLSEMFQDINKAVAGQQGQLDSLESNIMGTAESVHRTVYGDLRMADVYKSRRFWRFGKAKTPDMGTDVDWDEDGSKGKAGPARSYLSSTSGSRDPP